MPKRATSRPSDDVYVSGCQAKRIAGFTNWYSLHRLVMLGRVRTKLDPPDSIRYHRGDVERHARGSTAGAPDASRRAGVAPRASRPDTSGRDMTAK